MKGIFYFCQRLVLWSICLQLVFYPLVGMERALGQEFSADFLGGNNGAPQQLQEQQLSAQGKCPESDVGCAVTACNSDNGCIEKYCNDKPKEQQEDCRRMVAAKLTERSAEEKNKTQGLNNAIAWVNLGIPLINLIIWSFVDYVLLGTKSPCQSVSHRLIIIGILSNMVTNVTAFFYELVNSKKLYGELADFYKADKKGGADNQFVALNHLVKEQELSLDTLNVKKYGHVTALVIYTSALIAAIIEQAKFGGGLAGATELCAAAGKFTTPYLTRLNGFKWADTIGKYFRFGAIALRGLQVGSATGANVSSMEASKGDNKSAVTAGRTMQTVNAGVSFLMAFLILFNMFIAAPVKGVSNMTNQSWKEKIMWSPWTRIVCASVLVGLTGAMVGLIQTLVDTVTKRKKTIEEIRDRFKQVHAPGPLPSPEKVSAMVLLRSFLGELFPASAWGETAPGNPFPKVCLGGEELIDPTCSCRASGSCQKIALGDLGPPQLTKMPEVQRSVETMNKVFNGTVGFQEINADQALQDVAKMRSMASTMEHKLAPSMKKQLGKDYAPFEQKAWEVVTGLTKDIDRGQLDAWMKKFSFKNLLPYAMDGKELEKTNELYKGAEEAIKKDVVAKNIDPEFFNQEPLTPVGAEVGTEVSGSGEAEVKGVDAAADSLPGQGRTTPHYRYNSINGSTQSSIWDIISKRYLLKYQTVP